MWSSKVIERSFLGKSRRISPALRRKSNPLSVRNRRAHFEPLEQRTLLSVTFGLVGGVPTFTGDNANDQLTLQTNAAGNIEYIANFGPATDTGVAIASVNQVAVNLGDGNNGLTIDHSGAGGFFGNPAAVAFGVHYDGGSGSNYFFVNGSPLGTTVNFDILFLGPTPGTGVSYFQTTNFLTSHVYFQNVGLVEDAVPGPLTVEATAQDNAITIANSGGFSVAVDNQASILALDKTNPEIDGGGGDDTFSVNLTPGGLSGFTGTLTVAGNDPTASDKLIVNGTPAADTIDFTPTGADSGSVAITGESTVNFTGIESVVINGQGGNDALTVTTPAGNDVITLDEARWRTRATFRCGRA